MKIYTNHIKGKDYLYAYETIFIAKGKSVQKNKSLGRIDSSVDISFKKNKFEVFIAEEESKMRTKYWSSRTNYSKFRKYISIEKLESLRTKLYRGKQNMGSLANSAMETAFLVDFIYNSNKIEGSKVPRETIEKRVKYESRSINDEIGNTLKALYYVSKKFKFNLKHIENLYSTLLAHEPTKLGYRNERVAVGNEEVADWKDIKLKMKALLEWYKEARKTWYPPELAFEFYYRFERIHPFIDGNGRTGRLIMNKILKEHRYHPIIIWNKKRQAHETAFKSYVKGKGENYFKFMTDQFSKTYEIYTKKIQKAFNLEEKFEYFLTPSEYSQS